MSTNSDGFDRIQSDSELQPSLSAMNIPDPPGRFPLRKNRHERFAIARAAMFGLLEAAREAGYSDMTAGNAAKIDRMPKVRARVRYLARDIPAIVQATRDKVARKLNLISDASMADFIRLERDQTAIAVIEKTVADPEDRKKAIATLPVLPYLDMTRVATLTPDEQREVLSVVKSISYTDNGPRFELYSPLEATAQLRALNGLDVPKLDKMALTDPSGRNPFTMTANIEMLTDEQLMAIAIHHRPTIRLTRASAGQDSQHVENRTDEKKSEQELLSGGDSEER
jgi:hypothetical protein